MWNNALSCALLNQPWRMIALRRSSSSVSRAVNSAILRSLKDHFLDATKTSPPPKMDPPEPFEVVDGKSPVLRRSYGGGEEIRLSAARSAVAHGDGDEDDLSEVLLHVEVSKLKEDESLHFLCGLYSDAIGIHSVFMCPKGGAAGVYSESPVVSPTTYSGPNFRDLDERMREVFHNYLEERGVNESLFPFLQVWLYVKEHRKVVRWFKSVGTFIREKKPTEEA